MAVPCTFCSASRSKTWMLCKLQCRV